MCFSALLNLGSAYKERNDLLKATELWRECLSIFEKSLSATHPHLIIGIDHAGCDGLGNVLILDSF